MSKRQSPTNRQSTTDAVRWTVTNVTGGTEHARSATGAQTTDWPTKRAATEHVDRIGAGTVHRTDADGTTDAYHRDGDPVTFGTEPTDATDPEPTDATDPEPTERATVPERVAAFRSAFLAASTEPSAERDASALAAFLTVPRGKRDAERLAALGALVTEHATDPDALTAGSALAGSLAAAQSAPAPERGPDPATVLGSRADALATLAADTVGHALTLADPAGDTDTDDADAVVSVLAAFAGTTDPTTPAPSGAATSGDPDALALVVSLAFLADPDRTSDSDRALWRASFGGTRPDAERLPGRRGGGGGGGRSAGRSLDALAAGLTVADRYRQTTLTATVASTTDADGTERNVLRLADGSEHASPTAAARAARQPLAAAGVSVSVNGWTDAWRVADASGEPTARTLADAHDAATGTADDA